MPLKIGICEIDDALVLRVPSEARDARCHISRKIDYDRAMLEERRLSAGKAHQLLQDSLYILAKIPTVKFEPVRVHLSTWGGVAQILTDEEFQAALERAFPETAARVRETHERAEQRRAQLDRIWARGSWKAQRERHIVLAEEIKNNGQPPSNFPALTGSPKQIAWALDIRTEYALRHPNDPNLRRATRAQYWIENYKWVLEQPDP